MIHCFKKAQHCEVGSRQLRAQLSVLDDSNFLNHFPDLNDSDIEEANDTSKVDPDDDEDIHIEL